MLSGWAGWLLWGAGLVMQQLKKIKSVYLQPPPTKDLSLTMPSHILFSCYASWRFHWVGLGSTGMACVGCCACVCVLGGFHWKDNSNKIESANPKLNPP